MAEPQQLSGFETPDFGDPANYICQRRPGRFRLSDLDARPFLNLIRDKSFYNFFIFKSGLEDQPEGQANVKDSWQPHQFLGAGGYGKVGCWVKRDEKGDIVDRIAVKKVKYSKKRAAQPPLSREAAIHRQLNSPPCENIVHLRGYKHFQPKHEAGHTNHSKSEWRYYLEYAPYGHLYHLAETYFYWKTYFPEAFLWHIFDSLAEAAVKMKETSKIDHLSDHRYPNRNGDQVVNFDIKTENILIGYPKSHDQVSEQQHSSSGGTKKYNYPVIKLTDFGGAYLTGTNDPRNPNDYFDHGTLGWRPSEQVLYGYWWQDYDPQNTQFGNEKKPKDESPFDDDGEPIFEDDSADEDTTVEFRRGLKHNFQFLEKHHVWAIGKVVYDSMTLTDDYWWLSTESFKEFQRNGYQQIKNFDEIPFKECATTKVSPYSKDLTNLVRDCMCPLVAKRIDVAELKRRTKAGMKIWDDKWKPDCENLPNDGQTRSVDHPKLFYVDNEIIDMPEGSQNMNADYDKYDNMRWQNRGSLSRKSLRPKFDRRDDGPRTHLERWDEDWEKETPFQKTFEIVDGKLRFKEHDSEPSSSPSSPDENYLSSSPDSPDKELEDETSSNDSDDQNPRPGGGGGGGKKRSSGGEDDRGSKGNMRKRSAADEDQEPSGSKRVRLTSSAGNVVALANDSNGNSNANGNTFVGTTTAGNVAALANNSNGNGNGNGNTAVATTTADNGKTDNVDANTAANNVIDIIGPRVPISPTDSNATADPDDSDFEIVERRLRGRLVTYYRQRRRRARDDKRLRQRYREDSPPDFKSARDVNARQRLRATKWALKRAQLPLSSHPPAITTAAANDNQGQHANPAPTAAAKEKQGQHPNPTSTDSGLRQERSPGMPSVSPLNSSSSQKSQRSQQDGSGNEPSNLPDTSAPHENQESQSNENAQANVPQISIPTIIDGSTLRYRQAVDLAAQGVIPQFPSGVDPTDEDFSWNARYANYVTQIDGRLHEWYPNNTAPTNDDEADDQEQPEGEWRYLDTWSPSDRNFGLNRVGKRRIRGG